MLFFFYKFYINKYHDHNFITKDFQSNRPHQNYLMEIRSTNLFNYLQPSFIKSIHSCAQIKINYNLLRTFFSYDPAYIYMCVSNPEGLKMDLNCKCIHNSTMCVGNIEVFSIDVPHELHLLTWLPMSVPMLCANSTGTGNCWL